MYGRPFSWSLWPRLARDLGLNGSRRRRTQLMSSVAETALTLSQWALGNSASTSQTCGRSSSRQSTPAGARMRSSVTASHKPLKFNCGVTEENYQRRRLVITTAAMGGFRRSTFTTNGTSPFAVECEHSGSALAFFRLLCFLFIACY